MATPVTRRETITRQINTSFDDALTETTNEYEARFLRAEKAFRTQWKIINGAGSMVATYTKKWTTKIDLIQCLPWEFDSQEKNQNEEQTIRKTYQVILHREVALRVTVFSERIDAEISWFKQHLSHENENVIEGHIKKLDGFSKLVKKTRETFETNRIHLRDVATNLIHMLRKQELIGFGLSTGWDPVNGYKDKYNLDSLWGQPKLPKKRPTVVVEEEKEPSV